MKKIKLTWKYAFFLLLMFNLFVIIYIFWPAKDRPYLPKEELNVEGPTIHLETNKSELTGIINHFIKKKYGDQLFKYYVKLTDDLILYGNLHVFGEDVQFELHFYPEPLENGDLRLKQENMSIGNLNLPVSIIMNLISRAYEFPEWVEIKSNEKAIYLHLTQIKLENDFRIRVNEFDLEKDSISFQLFINETEDE